MTKHKPYSSPPIEESKAQWKLTPLRAQIFDLICQSEHPITAYELLRQLRQLRDSAEPPTVYRVLEFLEDAHLIHRIETKNAYIACVHPSEVHQNQIFLCNSCGKATEIEDPKVIEAIKTCAKKNGFYLSKELTEIRGICFACHKAGKN